MLFLIDENLPASLAQVFKDLGHSAESVVNLKQLRTRPDEAVFEYAMEKQSVIVTRDLGFGNPQRFDQTKIPGLILLRFPSEIKMQTIKDEVKNLVMNFEHDDFHRLIILEPGIIRSRKLPVR